MTTHEKQVAIAEVNQEISSVDILIWLAEPHSNEFRGYVNTRRDLRAKLFTLHGYARHTGNGHVLRIASLPDNLHILFDGHTVAQPIGWFVKSY